MEGKLDTQFPEVPTTADAMVARWAERDAEYAKARMTMSAEMATNIRSARMKEANRLPNVSERGRMFTRAKTWVPPVHPDFGSLRDYVE